MPLKSHACWVVPRPATKRPRRNPGAEGTYAADAIGEESPRRQRSWTSSTIAAGAKQRYAARSCRCAPQAGSTVRGRPFASPPKQQKKPSPFRRAAGTAATIRWTRGWLSQRSCKRDRNEYDRQSSIDGAAGESFLSVPFEVPVSPSVDPAGTGLDQRFRSSNHIRPPCRAYRPRCERRAPD